MTELSSLNHANPEGTASGDSSDSPDESVVPIEAEGPFANFLDLKSRPAHLGVFLHYVISNSDPAAVLFYLVSDQLQPLFPLHEKRTKEMQRWLYEIYSSFVAPKAPLGVVSISVGVSGQLDRLLAQEETQMEKLRAVFVRARQEALEGVNENLCDFAAKRTMGLGELFGENLLSGLAALGSQKGELQVLEKLMMRHFEAYLANDVEFESIDPRHQIILTTLATLLRSMDVVLTNPMHAQLLQKCPSFLAAGTAHSKLQRTDSKKAIQSAGHSLLLQPVHSTAICRVCDAIVFGVNPNAYVCTQCTTTVHTHCLPKLKMKCGQTSEDEKQRKMSEPSCQREKIVPTTVESNNNGMLNEDGGPSDGQKPQRSRMPVPVIDLSGAHDSDLEAENEIPALDAWIDKETLLHMKPKERKRQEVILELFHTERTHVRNLKIMLRVFYNPLLIQNILTPEAVELLFSNLVDMVTYHGALNETMKEMMKKSRQIHHIGQLLLNFFDGDNGSKFLAAAACYCQHQQHALDELKTLQKKDQKFAAFLQEQEGTSVCRKLQLKDMIPVEMQRLTKYPLLLENILKYTTDHSVEHKQVKKCFEQARAILDAVNTAKMNSENDKRRGEVHRILDTSPFDKEIDRAQSRHTEFVPYLHLDIRQFVLVHEGALVWKLSKNKTVDLCAILLPQVILLCTRVSEQRIVLRFHNCTTTSGRDDAKSTHCPVLRLHGILLRDSETDKRSFFLVTMSAAGPQIYELMAATQSDKKTWVRLISKQADKVKATSGTKRSSLIPDSIAHLFHNKRGTATQTQPPHTLESATMECLNAISKSDEEALKKPRLVSPDQISASNIVIYEDTTPIFSPLEKLKKADETILQCLLERQRALTTIYGVSANELTKLAEAVEAPVGRGPRELLLSSVVHTNRLLELINHEISQPQSSTDGPELDSIAITERPVEPPTAPSVPCHRLTYVAAPLMKCLTQLMTAVQQQEEDITRLRDEISVLKRRPSTQGASNRQSPVGSVKSPTTKPGTHPRSTPTPGRKPTTPTTPRNLKREVAKPSAKTSVASVSSQKSSRSSSRSSSIDGSKGILEATTHVVQSPTVECSNEMVTPKSEDTTKGKPKSNTTKPPTVAKQITQKTE